VVSLPPAVSDRGVETDHSPHLVLRLRMRGAIHNSPARLISIVLNYLRHRDNFAFTSDDVFKVINSFITKCTGKVALFFGTESEVHTSISFLISLRR
jgi:hypothetical protein